jgi:uncharacterized protein DUF1016
MLTSGHDVLSNNTEQSEPMANWRAMRRMVQFATTFSDEPIVATLSRQLSWSHFVSLLPLEDSINGDGGP